MKKTSFSKKLQYKFDNLMSKGSIALVGVLFLATSIVAILVGLVLALVDSTNPSWGANVWLSVMHIIDAGTITAADTGNISFIILMVIATICGLFVTSILIGIITTGFEEKLNDLKKGNSQVIEKDHVVILGFNDNIYTLISELVIANESQKDGCIVVLSPEEKEVVELAIATAIPDLKTTRVIARTGSISDTYMLGVCSIETSRSIIINKEEDFLTIKAVLAINNYLKTNGETEKLPHIVSTINDEDNYEAVQVISMGNIELILVEDFISRIIAQACRQPGLSNVLIELFDYDGDELYFESFRELTGETFGSCLNAFEKAIVFGISRSGKVMLNPPMDTLIQKGDELILLVEDNNMAKVTEHTVKDVCDLMNVTDSTQTPENILVIGINDMLERIISVVKDFFPKNSKIIIAAEDISTRPQIPSNQNITIEYVECDTSIRSNIKKLLQNEIEHVLVLSDDDIDEEISDSKTLLKLIHLRDLAEKEKLKFNITSELKKVENQKLTRVAKVNDLVIGSNIINLILTQVSENRKLACVFTELLQAEGSEIHIRPASNYIKLGVEVDFYEVTKLLQEKNEIAIGYKKQSDDYFDIVTNPLKSEKIIFEKGDAIIVLSEE